MTRSSLLVLVTCGLACTHSLVFSYPQKLQEVLGGIMQSPIHESLRESSIIPDVLDEFKPTYSLDITYPSSHESVTLGNNLSTSAVHDRPVYEFHPLVQSPAPPPKHLFHTLVLTDPDAKSRDNPVWSEFCHWIVANVSSPEEAVGGGETPETNVLMSYYPPAPPMGTGPHRYVFVLLEGDAEDSSKLKAPEDRKHWGYGKKRHGVRDWAKQNGLKVVGANFFYAEH